ncbi:MAG TPA: lanthionine synthetase LanC family protein, partial [Nitrososphaeraceae archaeon]|nr:lanthionine synthetase LanC family protein [Nitrososphaeraceae archaeon]
MVIVGKYLHIFNKPNTKSLKYDIMLSITVNTIEQDPLIDILSKEIIQKFDGEWNIESYKDNGFKWTMFKNLKKNIPVQGFKIHISASTRSAIDIIKKSIPILYNEKITFKIPSNLKELSNLNNGVGGNHQIGKFLTVYPYDNDQLVKVALDLDHATFGLEGPSIYLERSIRRGSLVHYRYGSFQKKTIHLTTGEIVPILYGPNNDPIIDDRTNPNKPFEWVNDPFIRYGIEPYVKQYQTLLHNRYIRSELLNNSPRFFTWLGLDTHDADFSLCIIKEAQRGLAIDYLGDDSQKRLKKEANILRNIQKFKFVPRFIDYWEDRDHSYLVYEYIEGTSMSSLIRKMVSTGIHIDELYIIRWTHELCNILEALHNNCLVFRDLKPSNLIIDKNGYIHLIDYELVEFYNNDNYAKSAGTMGYRSPQHAKGLAPTFQDDIYSLGATLLSIINMKDIAEMIEQFNMKDYVEIFGQHISYDLREIIKKCLENNLNKRFTTVNQIRLELTNNNFNRINSTLKGNKKKNRDYLDIAENIGDMICKTAITQGNMVYWISNHPICMREPTRDIYTGSSGIGLFLCNLYNVTKNDKYLSYAEKTALWLNEKTSRIKNNNDFLPGLYFGESGVGLFFLALYDITSNSKYLDLAIEKSNQVCSIAHKSPDITNGASGTGLYNLILYDITMNDIFKQRASNLGHFLLKNLKIGFTPYWNFPDELGFEKIKDSSFLGFAHGLAGIGYFMAELFDVTKEKQYLNKTIEIAGLLSEKASKTLIDKSGLNWPKDFDDSTFSTFWCHGATGIGLFFLKAFEITKNKDYLDIALRAGKTVSIVSKSLGTTQCHGLAGNIEFLLDLYQTTEKKDILGSAQELGNLLETYNTNNEDYNGWISDLPTIMTN